MKFETIKTIVLTILIIISLLLTFGLWNYQPNRDLLYTTNTKYVSEVDLGGIEETKRSIVKPNAIIFHSNNEYFGFKEPKEQQLLYQDMQDWVLSDYQLSDRKGDLDNQQLVEIIFPDAIPLDLIKSLFTVEEDGELPLWSFQRAYITFNDSYNTLNFYFVSLDEREQVRFTVNNAAMYIQLSSYFLTENNLIELIKYREERKAIYLPKDPLELRSRSLAIETITPTLLLNALFSNPSLVSSNVGEAYFTDGQRGMHVLQNGLNIEFINPIHSNKVQKAPVELIERSVLKVNEHKGWTDNFYLEDINLVENAVNYRMHYEGYPVYNRTGLANIEQQWRENELYQYARPLFKLNNLLGSDNVKLKSGEEVIEALETEGKYNLTEVKDIQLGYQLSYLEGASYSVLLYPAWFIKYKDEWQEMRFVEYEEMEKGGE